MEEDEVEELTPLSNKSVVWTYFGFLCKQRENEKLIVCITQTGPSLPYHCY